MKGKCATHHPISYFKVDGQWCCSACGRLGVWSDSWSYYGMLSCRKCHTEPAVEFVACSDACRAVYEPDHAAVSQSASAGKARPATLAEVDARIAAAEARLRALRCERGRVASPSPRPSGRV